MKSPIAIALFAAFTASAAGSAIAQTAAAPLDLSLPPDQAAIAAAAANAEDPPGTYYGDVAGKDSTSAARVSGSFSTTIGYAKGFGTGISNAASLNVSKQTDDGKQFDLHIHVTQSNGFPGRYPGYYYPGYYPGYGGY